MKFRNSFLVLTALLFQPAYAEVTTLVNAVETVPRNINIPVTVNSMMTFKPCSGECDKDYIRVQLTPVTKFRVQGKPVKFDDFRKQFALIKYSKNGYALVSYVATTRTVTSINISRL